MFNLMNGEQVVAQSQSPITYVQQEWEVDGVRYSDPHRVMTVADGAAAATEWLIDVGPFFDRFGPAKMPVLMSEDSTVKAIVQDTQVRKWIDLKRDDVASALGYIGIKVGALTPELIGSILNTPVTSEENLALRKLYF